MIKRQLFWWVIVAGLIIVGLTFLGDQHGHVMVVRHPYRVQLSFNMLLVMLVVAFILFYYLMRFLGTIKRLPSRWKNKKTIKQLNQQQDLLVKSVGAMLDDKPVEAKKLLQKVNKQSESEAITALITSIETKQDAPKQIEHKPEAS